MAVDNTLFHKTYKSLKSILPSGIVGGLRSFFTGIYTPIYFSYLSGHFKSSLNRKALSRAGEPLPWYTYPAIDFLRTRTFDQKTILEFGGGQSSLWWAKRAKAVVTFEEDSAWYGSLKKLIPPSVQLFLVADRSREKSIQDIEAILQTLSIQHFDIIVIDGLFREQLIEVACNHLATNGAIICDNAEGYGFYEGFKNKSYKRIDFYGHTPGVMIPHNTAIYCNENCFLLDPTYPMPTRS